MAGETKYITYSGGASGDWTCDGTADQVEINTALAWANANPGNIIKMRGPHTYNITGQIKYGSSTVWTAESGVILKIPNGACGTNRSDCVFPDGTPVIVNSGTITGIEIYGFEIDGNCQNQSTVLGLVHGTTIRSAGSGVERLIGCYGGKTSNYHLKDVHIHDMKFHDAFGEAVHARYCENIRVHDCDCRNHQHDAVFFLGVTGEGNKIYNNYIEAITDGAIRTDSCQNVKVYGNELTTYSGSNNNGAAKHGDNGMQIANNSSYDILTNNIEVFNNTFTNHGLCSIWINDQKKTAGTTSQTIHIYNNTFTGCGNPGNSDTTYAGGIAVNPWGNGITIEHNTFDSNYENAINVLGSITTSSTKVYVNNNNFVNQKGKAQSGSSISQAGYAICNVASKTISVVATANFCSGNLQTSNYYSVTPVSNSSTRNGLMASDTGGSDTTTDDTDTGTDTTDDSYIQPIRLIQDELTDYYILGRSAYINGVPFRWVNKKVDSDRSYSEDKSPGIIGTNIVDFDWKGATLTIDGYAWGEDDVDEILAAFNQEGVSTLEVGGVDTGYLVRGICINYGTELSLRDSAIPEKAYPFSVKFLMDEPYRKSTSQKIRSRYIYGNQQWSADDCYAGNMVKNPSFENWTISTEMDWDTQTSPSYSLRRICHSDDLDLFCAVSSDGYIITSDGNGTWTTEDAPTGTYYGVASGKSIDNEIYDVYSSEEYQIYSEDGYPLDVFSEANINTIFMAVGEGVIVTSSDADEWISRSCPAYTYKCVCYSDDLNRWGILANAGTGNRALYSDNGGLSFIQASILDNTGVWSGVDWSPTLQLYCAVSYDGKCAKSPDFITWTEVTIANQKWTDIKWCDTVFIAVSEDGTQQAAYTADCNTWTLMNTPYTESTSSSGGATAVAQDPMVTPAGSSYSSLADEYTDSTSLQITHTLATRTDGKRYRVDQVYGFVRSYSASYIGYLRVTVKIGSGTETQVAEWSNSTGSFGSAHSLDLALEGSANEQILIKYYLRSSSTSYRAYGTVFKSSYSLVSGTGSSTISYARNLWEALAYGNNMVVAIAKSGTSKRVMYSTDKSTWNITESALDENLTSIAYGADKFIAVASSGANRIMESSGLGAYKDVAPLNWTYVSGGFERTEDTAHDGDYAIQINGDGATAERGLLTQPLTFESGTSYILSAWGKTENLTTGSVRADLYAGGTVVKELIFDSTHTDWTQKKIRVRWDVAPSDAIVRIHSSGTPNDGALLFIDDLLVERASDFEIGITGKDISTSGTVDVIPDVQVKGLTSQSAPSASEYQMPNVESTSAYSSAATAYSTEDTSLEFTHIIPADTSGIYYKINGIAASIKTATAGNTAYVKVTYQLTGGSETQIVEWTNNTAVYVAKSLTTAIDVPAGKSCTVRFYMKTSNASSRAYGDSFTIRLIRYTPGVGNGTASGGIAIWNTQDNARVLTCCRSIYPGATLEIKADGTGSYRISEGFLNDDFLDYCYSKSGVTYNSENHSIVIASGGSLVLPVCDVVYPVTGVPYIDLVVKSGIPQFSISSDASTWYSIDGNTSTAVTDTEIYRELDNDENLKLNTKTKYYIKITPYTGASCEFGSLFHYTDMVTIDAIIPKIYKGGEPQTFKSAITGSCSAIVTLKYRDSRFVR